MGAGTDESAGGLKLMSEYRIGSAIVRVHGNPDPERLKTAAERFMKQAIAARKKALKEGRKGERV